MNLAEEMQIKYYNYKAGEYLCECLWCKRTFVGDKRDRTCPTCEYKNIVNKLQAAQQEIGRLSKLVDKLTAQ